MRYRKTPKNRRETYKLYDDKENLVAEYRPGVDGVTEVDIANLHKLDDHESYINNKERRLPEWYQGVYDEWRERYITKYEEQYGCKPSEQEIPGGHRIFDYLDTDETEEDNSKEYLQAALAVSDEKEASDVVIDKLTLFAGKHIIRYRVRTIGSKDYFSWMENKKDTGGSSDTFAGESGKSIDRLQIIVKE